MHPYRIPEALAERLMTRRGRLHPFESLDPLRTALVVIDMQDAFCVPGMPLEVPAARGIAGNINALVHAVRDAGGVVVWVSMTVPTLADWPVYLEDLLVPNLARDVQQSLQPGMPGHALWHEMPVDADKDLMLPKSRFSAFLPSSSDLAQRLRQQGIDTVLIAGTLTNVCCESSARDAAMQDFRVTMVSDANAARSGEDHAAALNMFLQAFGDVRTTAETLALVRESLRPGRARAGGARTSS